MGKRKIGRPSELTESLKEAKKYLDGGYENGKELVPSVAGLACFLGKARSTIYEYANKSDEFSDILEAILALQESKLITGGLDNEFNSTITKLMLTKHGYSEKQDINHLSADGSMTPKPTIIELISPD